MNSIVIADQRFNEVMNLIPNVKDEEQPKDIIKFKAKEKNPLPYFFLKIFSIFYCISW